VLTPVAHPADEHVKADAGGVISAIRTKVGKGQVKGRRGAVDGDHG